MSHRPCFYAAQYSGIVTDAIKSRLFTQFYLCPSVLFCVVKTFACFFFLYVCGTLVEEVQILGKKYDNALLPFVLHKMALK
jgi:hypothetical protein